MSFTEQRAYELLSTAYRAGRFPHALLLIGDETDGANDLALRLLQMANPTTHGDTLESARDAYFRLVRPRSKSRRILIDDIRQIEPFLQQTAPEDRLKVVAILEAERMNEEASNAFLKTLEEPPRQTLIMMITAHPEQLLPTILSRCINVPLYSNNSTVRLSPIQEAVLPLWANACEHVGDDLAALAFRAKFLELLNARKAEITKTITQALKEEAKEIASGTDLGNWESRQKDVTTAQIEMEYLSDRDQALELMNLWFSQAALLASQAENVSPIHPGVQKMASSLSLQDLMQRMSAVDTLMNDLKFNVHEGLTFDVHMLRILGKAELN